MLCSDNPDLQNEKKWSTFVIYSFVFWFCFRFFFSLPDLFILFVLETERNTVSHSTAIFSTCFAWLNVKCNYNYRIFNGFWLPVFGDLKVLYSNIWDNFLKFIWTQKMKTGFYNLCYMGFFNLLTCTYHRLLRSAG